MPMKEENGGRHKPRVRNVKERSGKKNHKNKGKQQMGAAQYNALGASQYIWDCLIQKQFVGDR